MITYLTNTSPMKPVGELLEKYQNILLKGFDPVSAGGFTQVPNCLLQAKTLTLNAKLVYAQLLHYAWTNNYCYPGQERMADDIGSTKSTVNRAIQELQAAGWLELERRGQGKTNIYVLKYVVEKAVVRVTEPEAGKVSTQVSAKTNRRDTHRDAARSISRSAARHPIVDKSLRYRG